MVKTKQLIPQEATYVSEAIQTETATLCAVIVRTMYGSELNKRVAFERAAATAVQLNRLIAAHVAKQEGRIDAVETVVREGLHKIGNDITEHFSPKPEPEPTLAAPELKRRAITYFVTALRRCNFRANYSTAEDVIKELEKSGYTITRI
jgi:hypothetical protein